MLSSALAAQNLIAPAGTQKIGSYEYTVNLNNAPSDINQLGDLPIKVVNGAMVYVRDVASVRDGNAVQTNIVHVDGGRSVLMSVFKNGATSTLDIIDGIKAMIDVLKPSLPDKLEVKPVGDQSIFVRNAIGGVIKEGVIAAALTSLMILLFLGSWRSTLIVATSIPLSILGAVIGLSALGETLNIMTLGGLALAVGILVDEATVTIESINYHLEQGKEVEQAIMDGASQIVVPAFVSLLCICIVFVPMFFLEGVARFLFVPMAEAVMLAMVFSFILSRTLVPTMAKYLLQKHEAHADAHGNVIDDAPVTRNPLVKFQRGFERGFLQLRKGYHDLLALCIEHRKMFVAGFLLVVAASFLMVPLVGRNFFPAVDAGQILMHVRVQVGTRVEDTAGRFGDVENAIREIIPANELSAMVDNVGSYISSINTIYNNTGTIGEQDGDIQISLKEDHHTGRRLHPPPARRAAAPLPGLHVLVPAGRHRQPDPEFRRAVADRSAGARQRSGRELRLRQQAARAGAQDSGRGRCAHPAVVAGAGAQCRRRPLARAIRGRDRARRDQQPRHVSWPVRARSRPRIGSIRPMACRIRS